jgi:hybrid cluster-associated redox disulfide protein
MAHTLTVHLTMADLLAGWPEAGTVLGRRGMACVGCPMARFETIAEAAAAYEFDAEALLDEVRRHTSSRRRRHSS